VRRSKGSLSRSEGEGSGYDEYTRTHCVDIISVSLPIYWWAYTVRHTKIALLSFVGMGDLNEMGLCTKTLKDGV
jgi:hypothetical protein